MANCYNCGIGIPDDDKTRLCDKCKSILLPFVKFTNASTSSSVRRLITNERNLRNAGVTDSGMEYLIKICELQDKKKQQEREEREAAKTRTAPPVPETPPVEEITPNYMEVELPADEPLLVYRKPYGTALTAAAVILLLCGLGLLAWFGVQFALDKVLDYASLLCGIASFTAAYLCFTAKKLIHDVEELKKRFR